METLNEVGVIWWAEVQRALRSARVISLLALYLMGTAMLLLFLGYPVWRGMDVSMGLQGAAGTEDPALAESLANVPSIVLRIYQASLYFLPPFIAIMGFDQISGELGPRSIRYLVVRARRSSILLGKYLSQAALLAALVLVVDVVVIGVTRWLVPSFGAPAMAAALGRCWLAAGVFSLAYVALGTLCSSLTRSAGVSLIINLFLVLGFWLLQIIGSIGRWVLENTAEGEARSRFATVASWLSYASPAHYSTNLLHPHLTTLLGSAGAYLGFMAGFLLLGYAVLRRRDL